MAYTTIDDPTKFFSTNLWVGDDTSPRTLTGFGHQPDFVWARYRDGGSLNNVLTNSLRGGDKMLFSNSTLGEDTKSHGEITSFNSDGITVADGTNATYPRLYFNDDDPFGAGTAGNYVGWSWKAGGTAVSNGDGSIASSVSANQTAGFSIVSFTGTQSVGTVGHGLGAVPAAFIVKNTAASSDAWYVYHQGLASDPQTDYIILNSTAAAVDYNTPWNDTAPTSSVFTVGADGGTNESGSTMLAYCFAEIKGYSKFGKWTGNGNADGPFVYTGFRPAFVMLKDHTSGSGYNWIIIDSTRSPTNGIGKRLQPSSTNGEYTDVSNFCDFTANGFKWRGSQANWNASSVGYIYFAFAEHPFVTEGTKAAGTAR